MSNKLEQVTRRLQKTTDYAKLMEEQIQGTVQEDKAKAAAEEEKGPTPADKKTKRKRETGIDEHDSRTRTITKLHEEMDKQVANRKYRFEDAFMHLDTTTQCKGNQVA